MDNPFDRIERGLRRVPGVLANHLGRLASGSSEAVINRQAMTAGFINMPFGEFRQTIQDPTGRHAVGRCIDDEVARATWTARNIDELTPAFGSFGQFAAIINGLRATSNAACDQALLELTDKPAYFQLACDAMDCSRLTNQLAADDGSGVLLLASDILDTFQERGFIQGYAKYPNLLEALTVAIEQQGFVLFGDDDGRYTNTLLVCSDYFFPDQASPSLSILRANTSDTNIDVEESQTSTEQLLAELYGDGLDVSFSPIVCAPGKLTTLDVHQMYGRLYAGFASYLDDLEG